MKVDETIYPSQAHARFEAQKNGWLPTEDRDVMVRGGESIRLHRNGREYVWVTP